MKKSRTAVIALILEGLLSVSARAQGVPGRWEKVEALKLGSRITLELKNGDRIGGQFGGLSSSELSLIIGSAQAVIPRSDIRRITTREPEPLANGILIGARQASLTHRAIQPWPWPKLACDNVLYNTG